MDLGFFTETDPNIAVHVNGEPVLSAASHSRSGSASRFQQRRGRHSAGNVSGLTMVDFLALPARARVSVTYDGEAHAQGFVQLRKL